MNFDNLLDQAADYIKQHDDITFFSHVDADGLCATAILTQACNELGKKIHTVFIEQISSTALKNLSMDDPSIFIDMGSSHLTQISESFKDALILDHHQCEGDTKFLLVNPFLANLNGTRDACTASIAWEVASRLIDAKNLAPIAVIGAQADHQEPFTNYNEKILNLGMEKNLIKAREGTRLYGIQTKPVTKLLAYSYDLKIDRIRKNPRAAQRFLDDLGIPAYVNGRERMFGDLTEDEQKKLDKTLIEQSPNPDVQITHHTLLGFMGPLRDTREAATLLNACGRLGKPELAVELLLGGDPSQARDIQREYRQLVHDAHEWYRRGGHIERDDLVIVNAENQIPPSVAGTLCSVLVRGKEVPDGTTVICLARNRDGTKTTKVSSRTSGERDLALLMGTAAKAVDGEGGGHTVAAGAIIPTENEQEFIEELLK